MRGRAQPIVDDRGVWYPSISVAARAIGSRVCDISRVLSGKCRTARGRSFRHISDGEQPPYAPARKRGRRYGHPRHVLIDQHGERWGSVREVRWALGGSGEHLSQHLRGERPHFKGLVLRIAAQVTEDP